jgi:Na+/H+-dicarboxylate symporter
MTNKSENAGPTLGFGILGRYPVLSVVGFAAMGIGIGVGLSFWDPSEAKSITIQWLGLVGDLFIRALKAVVLPLVFCNVILSVVDMVSMGRTGSVAGYTLGMYLLTTAIAAILGLISILCFQGLFEVGNFEEDGPAMVSMGCNEDGYYIAEANDGTLVCSNSLPEANMNFIFNDISGSLARKSSGPRNDISLSDTFYDGVFMKLVTSNITSSFATANFAAVVIFAIFFGLALGRICVNKNADAENALVTILREINDVLITLINWIIMFTPIAVLSLIVKAIGKQSDLGTTFANVGYLMAAAIIAKLVHFGVVHVGLLGFFTKKNPFDFLKHIVPAQTTAFACASSAATIPVTLRCVKNSGVVPDPIRNFVVPLGATINMDGGAIYFPCACIWLASLNGETINAGSYILLIILATIGSMGTAPVPSASLVLIITAYNTVFNATGTPDGMEYIFAIDWFMDRLRTTLNVTGDAVVTGIVAAKCPMETSGKSLEDLDEEDPKKNNEQRPEQPIDN